MISFKVLNRKRMCYLELHPMCSCTKSSHCTKDRMHIGSWSQDSCSFESKHWFKVCRCRRQLLDRMDLYIARKAMIHRKCLSKCKQFFIHWLNLSMFEESKLKCMYNTVKQIHSSSYSKLGLRRHLHKDYKSFQFPSRMQDKNRASRNITESQLHCLYSHRSHKKYWH